MFRLDNFDVLLHPFPENTLNMSSDLVRDARHMGATFGRMDAVDERHVHERIGGGQRQSDVPFVGLNHDMFFRSVNLDM